MMDIAEIRKKARKEKEQLFEPGCSSKPQSVSGAVSEGMQEAATLSDDFFPAPAASPPARVTPASPVNYDPLALILEGRKAALVEDERLSGAQEEVLQDEEASLELLCFRVADEMYSINIMEIKEIIKPRETTEIPHAPPFIAGVLSLRGFIIPVFLLRARLGLDSCHETGKERIIVVKQGEGLCGLLVDEVIQVVRIAAGTIEHPPAVLDGIDREFVSGIGRHDGQMIILLHLPKVLDANLS